MSGKPAILILVENLPVPLDRRVWQEAKELSQAGYEVVVICPKMHGYVLAEEMLEGIQIYRHGMLAEGRGFLGFFCEYASALWGETRLAWKAWRRHRFRLIHLCNPPDLLFLVAAPFKLLGVRVIFDVHDLWPEMFEAKFGRRGLLYWAVRLAERLTYATADVVLATNESIREVAIERGGKAGERVFTVRTAPKIGRTDIVEEPALKKGRRFLVGYVGVMGSADGVDQLVLAAEDIVRRQGRADVQFALMGTGPEYARLVELRDRLGLAEFVDLPGWVYNDALFRALKTIDLGVSCDPKNSYNDHCTMNKVLEYMVFGKAQVLYDLKEGRASAADAAYYVPEGSVEALAAAITRLLDDEELRESMGRIGRERLENELSWGRSVEKLLLAYRAALS